jgi:hypothetical protein
MGYRIVVVSVFVALAVCSAALVSAMHPLTALLPVSGATDITIVMLGWKAWQTSYYTAADVSGQIKSRGWSNADDQQYGPLGHAYTRTTSLGVGQLWEWAFVWRDPAEPQIAHVRERRWIEFAWWRHLLRALPV